MKRSLKALGLALVCGGVFIAGSSYAGAQDQAKGALERARSFEKGKRMGRRGGDRMHGLRGVNLSDEQKQLIRAIRERHAESTRSQREELRQLFSQKGDGAVTAEQRTRAQALRSELREASKKAREETLAVLTPKKRTEMHKAREERKARRLEWRKKRTGAETIG